MPHLPLRQLESPKTATGTSEVSEVPVNVGGPSRTRTLDPLIKSRLTAAQETGHFAGSRHIINDLKTARQRHMPQQRTVLASTAATFSPQISPQPMIH